MPIAGYLRRNQILGRAVVEFILASGKAGTLLPTDVSWVDVRGLGPRIIIDMTATAANAKLIGRLNTTAPPGTTDAGVTIKTVTVGTARSLLVVSGPMGYLKFTATTATAGTVTVHGFGHAG